MIPAAAEFLPRPSCPAHQQHHDARQHRGDDRHAHGARHPLLPLVRGGDVGPQVLGAGDDPGLGVPDPPAVDAEPVRQVHDGQDEQQLPEAREEAPRSVDGVDAHQHIGDVARDAAELEAPPVPLDLRLRREAQGDAARLHLRAVEMHHAHGAVPDADGADQHEQHGEADALQKHL